MLLSPLKAHSVPLEKKKAKKKRIAAWATFVSLGETFRVDQSLICNSQASWGGTEKGFKDHNLVWQRQTEDLYEVKENRGECLISVVWPLVLGISPFFRCVSLNTDLLHICKLHQWVSYSVKEERGVQAGGLRAWGGRGGRRLQLF